MPGQMIPDSRGRLWPINVMQRIQPPNQFNRVLDLDSKLWLRINTCGGLQAVCPGVQTRYREPPWVRQPPQGKRFSKIGSIPLPAADGLDHLVESFLVPVGYDGVIVSTVNEYTGMGFAEGSGDLTWRIQLNYRYVKDYGNITTTIGSLQTPYNINSGAIRLKSRQLVQFFVNRSVASLGNLNGGRIICGLFGWFYPR